MKFNIQKKELEKNLVKIGSMIGSNLTIPVLKGIYFKVNSDKLILIGSNGFNSIKIETDNDGAILDISKTGEFILPNYYIVELIRKIDSTYITFETIESNTIQIYNNKSKFTVNSWKTELYPTNIDFTVAGTELLFNTNLIKEINNQIIYAVDSENKSQNEILQGINFIEGNNKTKFIATNSHRLALKTIDKLGQNLNVVLQPEIFKIIPKLFDKNKEIKVFINPNKTSFVSENNVLQFQNKQGVYPDVSQIIPNEFTTNIIVDKTEFIRALERINLILGLDIGKVKIKTDTNFLELSTQQTKIGFVHERIQNFNITGLATEFWCSTKYLIEALNTFKTKEIKIQVESNLKPLLIWNNIDKKLIQVISPIKSG